MTEQPLEFPPFDESWRPTVGTDGRQLSIGTFVRWISPAIWLDEQGCYHIDVPAWHRWLGLPMNTASIRDTGLMIRAMMESEAVAASADTEVVIISRTSPP